jgi:hypothetical protein
MKQTRQWDGLLSLELLLLLGLLCLCGSPIALDGR